jgi:hypothetical protein
MNIHWLQAFIFFGLGAFFGPMILAKLTGGKKTAGSY